MSNDQPDRDRRMSDLIDAYERLMHRLAVAHAPVFAEVDLTMAQSKALYVVFALGRPRMSDVAARLGVSLSAASEVVDRLVDLDLVGREADPADRRHVILVALPRAAQVIERFRELGVAQLRELLARVTDHELDTVRRAVAILERAAETTDVDATPTAPRTATPTATTPGSHS